MVLNEAALEFRHSYIAPTVTHAKSLSHVQQQAAFADMLRHEQHFDSAPRPEHKAAALPAPKKTLEGIEDRSLPTNIVDHPTAINVNTLRQSATPLAHWSGLVTGVQSFSSSVLVGNWQEDRTLAPTQRGTQSVLSKPLGWDTTQEEASAWAREHYPSTDGPSEQPASFQTTAQAAAQDAFVDKAPKASRRRFDVDSYRQEWTVGNEATRARFASTENREQFHSFPRAVDTTGFPRVSCCPRRIMTARS